MPFFQGNPDSPAEQQQAQGQTFFDPRTDEPAPVDAEGQGDTGSPQAEDEETLFKTLIDTVNKLRGLPTVSEQNKLALEKAGTLIQQIKAAEEKEMEGAMKGAMTPGLLRKANGGGPMMGAGQAGAGGY